MRCRFPFSMAGLVGLATACLAVGVVWIAFWAKPAVPRVVADSSRSPRQFAREGLLTVWWDEPPLDVQITTVRTGQDSNIHPSDYVGPEACKECHPANYQSWSTHPHRWMNGLASEATVKGDFSGAADMVYRGGHATFFRRDGRYLMRLERDGVRRTYQVNQTIGSRFYQRYVGKQLEGPEPKSHHFYSTDHVLPFGYWLELKEWIPIVHLGPERPDEQRPDPFLPPESGVYYAEYSIGCNYCHTTFALGDLLGRFPARLGQHAPMPLHWSLRQYLEDAHADLLPSIANVVDQVDADKALVRNPMGDWEASRHAVMLGIGCEACHLGGRAHVESRGRMPPKFFPSSPHLRVEARDPGLDYGRVHDNVNWACGRCHAGHRPSFAAGMGTWNSTEYSDAMHGSCYSQLRCVDCHNPHRPIGRRWSLAPDQDDALCLKCHDRLQPAAQRVAHTHHAIGSEGARCMNCHMPRLNEGLQDVVRTHMIYSPTRADMIEANHPNACNLCHLQQPVGWTLRYLKEWYGAKFDEGKIAANYPHQGDGVARGWLRSENPAVRLVAVEAMTRAKDFQALPLLLAALDDPYLVNRQFAYKGLQEMVNLSLRDYGYRFYMAGNERRQALADLQARLGRTAGPGSAK